MLTRLVLGAISNSPHERISWLVKTTWFIKDTKIRTSRLKTVLGKVSTSTHSYCAILRRKDVVKRKFSQYFGRSTIDDRRKNVLHAWMIPIYRSSARYLVPFLTMRLSLAVRTVHEPARGSRNVGMLESRTLSHLSLSPNLNLPAGPPKLKKIEVFPTLVSILQHQAPQTGASARKRPLCCTSLKNGEVTASPTPHAP